MRLFRLLVAALLVAASAPADAIFHLMSIREVYVGPAADASAQYVELQMYDDGQGEVGGHNLTFYGATGTLLGTVTFPADVPNGAGGSYILVATTQAETRFAIDADLTMTALLTPAGGKVCFDTVDCFSWGTYSGQSTTPSPSGTPFNAAGGLTADTAVTRDISGGTHASALDAADDTNDSAADFNFAAVPDPHNNAEGGGGPGGGCGYLEECGGGGGGGGGYGGGAPSLASLLLLLLAAGARRRS